MRRTILMSLFLSVLLCWALAKSAGGTGDERDATPPPAAIKAESATSVEADSETSRERLIRLRSKAEALRSQLYELRQNQAAQGLSMRSDALEWMSSMDSALSEAYRLLNTGDRNGADRQLDKAEHFGKKISSLFGR